MRDVSYEQDGSYCLMLLQQGEAPFLVMGAPVFYDYYVVHDDEAGKLGFVPQIGSEKKGPFAAGDKPWIKLTDAAKREEILDTKTEEQKEIEKLEKKIDNLEIVALIGIATGAFLLVVLIIM